MKLINYNLGYKSKFECSIHGTLVLSKKEFKDLNYMFKMYCFDYKEAMTKNYSIDKNDNQYYSFGITPIEKIAKKFKLTNYQKRNYQVKVI